MNALVNIILRFNLVLQAYPLDMSQYSSLFNSTRIPKVKKDILVKNESGRHILVLRNGHFFKVNVIDDNGLYSISNVFIFINFIEYFYCVCDF